MAIRENSTVKVIGGLYDGKAGKVVKVHEYADIAVVSFDDNGDVGKVSLSALVEVQPQESRIVDVKIEIPEGAKKISRAEFMDAITQVTKPDKIVERLGAEKGMLAGLSALVMGMKLPERLFGEDEIIVITRDQLFQEIAATVADEDPKFMIVAFACSLILRDIADILFTDGSDNG